MADDNTSTETDQAALAYCAGIFDGEGCVATYARGRSIAVVPSVVMTDPQALHRLQSIFGGVVSPMAIRAKRRRAWRWLVYGADATRFFERVEPFLLVRREEVQLAIQLRKLIEAGGVDMARGLSIEQATERRALMQRIRDLKRVDYAVTEATL